MYTLIPEQIAIGLKREYRIRAMILLLLFLSLAIWIGIVSLFPSYLVSIQREKDASNKASSALNTVRSASTTAAIMQITAANTAIVDLQKMQDTLALSSIVEDIASRRPSGVIINDFEISHSGKSGASIAVRGTALTRDALVMFEDNLNADVRFSKVDLPLSNLASDKNILFTMNITGIQ